MNFPAPRRAALEILRAVRDGELAGRALRRFTAAMEARDRAWTREVVYGTLRLRGRLDHVLAQSVHRGLDSLEPDVLDVLRLGVYQLTEMSGVPAYAAVSESVELARAASGPASVSLVNGVLRHVERTGEFPFPAFDEDPLEHLSTRGSHPRWLIERWLARWGADSTRRLVEQNNARAETFVRPLGLDRAEAMSRLAGAGVEAEPFDISPEVLRLARAADVRPALAAANAVVQDPGAALVVRYADLRGNGILADLCAAPGGKALALAEAWTGVLVAADVSPTRLARLRENARRVGTRLLLMAADARAPGTRSADAVLLDVPCTGTGTFRRHPDARWRIGPSDLNALMRLQCEILEGGSRVVRPGGMLVYATCSIEAEENEAQVNAFLKRHPEFEAVPGGPVDASCLDEAGHLQVLPQRHGCDGAYAARLRRR